jgi:hypothetical protein
MSFLCIIGENKKRGQREVPLDMVHTDAPGDNDIIHKGIILPRQVGTSLITEEGLGLYIDCFIMYGAQPCAQIRCPSSEFFCSRV